MRKILPSLCAMSLLLGVHAARAASAADAAVEDGDALASAFSEEWSDAYAAAPAQAQAQAQVEPAAAPAATPALPDDSLLPANLGPMEHVFWGRHGMMRSIGFPLTEEGRERELGLRRGMLTAHQIGGFLTLGLMAATVITGQMIINDENSYDRLIDRKRLLAKLTIGSYFTTAGFALLSPPPMIRRKQFSSLTLHKALGVVHFTGMVVAPVLGLMLRDATGADYNTIRTYHQVNGYITMAALTGAMLVITFD